VGNKQASGPRILLVFDEGCQQPREVMIRDKAQALAAGGLGQRMAGLLALLLLPAITAVAYGLALAYEWGVLDAYGAPRMLARVDLGQLVVPGAITLLFVGFAMLYVFGFTLLVGIYRRTAFAKFFVWFTMTSFFLNFGLWGLAVLALIVLARQGRHAKRRRYAWEMLFGLYIVAGSAAAFGKYHSRLDLGTEYIVTFWVVLAMTTLLFAAHSLALRLHEKSRPVPRVIGMIMRASTAIDFGIPDDLRDMPRIGLVLGAMLLSLVILAGTGVGMYRLGETSSDRDYATVISGPRGEKAAIIRLYSDRAITGVFDPKTNRLTGEWRIVGYSDSTPLDITIEQHRILLAR
jgi:hypothetical protein